MTSQSDKKHQSSDKDEPASERTVTRYNQIGAESPDGLLVFHDDYNDLLNEISWLREKLADAYVLASGKRVHASDCATSCAPAEVPGPCDCSVPPPIEERGACHDAAERDEGCFRALKAERELAEAKAQLNAGMRLSAPSAIEPSEIQVEGLARLFSESPLIDAPKLPPVAWMGFARHCLEYIRLPTQRTETLPTDFRGRSVSNSSSPFAPAEELRNMDSAPKDGTPFLAWLPTYYQGKGAWAIVLMLHGDWMDNRAWKVEPTGWMPLPPGPDGKQDG